MCLVCIFYEYIHSTTLSLALQPAYDMYTLLYVVAHSIHIFASVILEFFWWALFVVEYYTTKIRKVGTSKLNAQLKPTSAPDVCTMTIMQNFD